MNPVPDMDGRLYHAIQRSLGRWADNLYDLKKIKVLDDFTWSVDPYYERPWGKLASGDFSAIGLMENLHTLVFFSQLKAQDSVLEVNDFSFLTRCKKLKKLDLENTNFSDCSLLAELPALKSVKLPAKKQLEHTEVLDTLSCQVTTDEPFYLDSLFPNYETIPIQEVPPTADGLAIRFLSFGHEEYESGNIPQEALKKAGRKIRRGDINFCWMGLDDYGEEDTLSVEIEHGWAAVMVTLWNEEGESCGYWPINEAYDSVEELAPVEIGGQTPVPKRFALDNLDLAAECALYFARTGELYPGVPWAKFD